MSNGDVDAGSHLIQDGQARQGRCTGLGKRACHTTSSGIAQPLKWQWRITSGGSCITSRRHATDVTGDSRGCDCSMYSSIIYLNHQHGTVVRSGVGGAQVRRCCQRQQQQHR